MFDSTRRDPETMRAQRGTIGDVNVLIIGPSGSGKSALGRLLSVRGFRVVDADVDTHQGASIAYFRSRTTGDGVNATWPLRAGWTDEHDWVWRPQVLQRLLDEGPDQINFVCGDARNKQDAYPLFDWIFFLSADDETLRLRIAGREDHDFGKDPAEFAGIVEENRALASQVRGAGGIILEASRPVDELADEILARLAGH